MTKRYADRFFGPADRGEAGSSSHAARVEPPDPTRIEPRTIPSWSADRLESGPTDQHVYVPPAWWARSHVGIAIAVAFAVGIGAGAYAWERHRATETLAAARATVNMTANITYINRFRERIEVGVTFTNHGDYTVQAAPPSFVDSTLVAAEGGGVSLPIKPHGSATRIVTASINCPTEAADDNWTPNLDLVATITTLDGAARPTTFPIDEDTFAFATDLSRICGAMSLTIDDVYFYVTTVGNTPEGDVTSQLVVGDTFEVGRYDPVAARNSEVHLDSVEVGNGSGAYTVTVTPELPTVVFPGAQLSVRWAVDDCAQASKAFSTDMRLTFRGHVNDGYTGLVHLDDASVDLAAALVRMAYVRCSTKAGTVPNG